MQDNKYFSVKRCLFLKIFSQQSVCALSLCWDKALYKMLQLILSYKGTP